MKYLQYAIAVTLLFIICLKGNAQQPEKIYSIVRVLKTNEYYKQQMVLWKKELDKDPQNADAWFNYYKANRYVQLSQAGDSINIPNRFERLNRIVQEIETKIPNTFEANYIKWWNGYNNEDLLPYLEKAYQLDSTRYETYSDWVNHYEITRNIAQKERFLQKWYQSGNASPGLLQYNYNMLVSLKPNAILITGGDNDTYFAWMLQAVFGIRKDVIVVNTALLAINEQYTARLSKELKAAIVWNKATITFEDYQKTLLGKIAENKAGKPLYTAVTAYDGITKGYADKLYLEGLVYEYSEQKIDNIALMIKNFEKEYLLDYINKFFGQDPYETIVPYMNTNYLIPMLTLYEHYKQCDEQEKARHWKEMILIVAEKGGKTQDLKNYFQ